MKSLLSIGGAMICALIAGCGPSGPELGKVTGKVTLYGRPLPKALVAFEPEGGGPVAVSPTDDEGNYELFSAGRRGAQVGKHKVVITTIKETKKAPDPVGAKSSDDPAYMAQAISSPSDYKKVEAANKEAKEPIPAKFNSASELKEEVKSGSQEINFDLK